MRKTILCVGLCALGALSCKKDNAPVGEEGAAAVAEKALKATKGALVNPIAAKSGADAMSSAIKHFDKDTTAFVMGLNIQSLATTKIYKDNADKINEKLPEEFKNIEVVCGVSPLLMIKQVVVGAKADHEGKKDDDALVWVEGLGRDKLEGCVKSLAEKDKKKFTMTEKDGVVTYTVDGEVMTVAWLDNEHFLMTSDKTDAAWFKERAEAKNGLDQSKTFSDLLKHVDASSGVWFAAGGDANKSQMAKGIEKSPVEDAQAVFGNIALSGGFTLKGGVVFESKEKAATSTKETKEALSKFSKQMPFVSQYLDKILLDSDGANMMFNFTLTEQDIAGLTALASGMMGGMK